MRRSRDVQTALMSVHAHSVRPTRRSRLAPLSSSHAMRTLAEQRDAHCVPRLHCACAQAEQPLPKEALEYEVFQGKIVPEFMDPETITYDVTSTVARPFEHMKYILDPRSWGRCSDFFDPENTYQIRTINGLPQRDKKGRYIEETNGSPIGQAWSGLLRERFDGPGVSVDNTLVIRFLPKDDEIVVEYGLYLSERCMLGPFTDVGGLLKNTGEVRATRGDPVSVRVTKTLRFFDYTPGDAGEFVDFGEALSMLMAVMGVALISDKFILKLNCHLEPGLAGHP